LIYGKPSSRRTALNRCTQTESRWNKKKTFSIVARTCCDAPVKFAQNVESSLIERTMRLNSYWVKGVL